MATQRVSSDAPRSSLAAAISAGLRLGYEYLATYALWLFFGIASLTYALICTLLYPFVPRSLSERGTQAAICQLFRLMVALFNATGLGRLDTRVIDQLHDGPPLVIAANHPAFWDAMLIISRLPNVVCIMKAPVWNNVFLGSSARLAGYIRNDSPLDMVRGAAQALREGKHLLVFPEGTRTVRAPINDFKGGFALIAKQAAVPVQTVFIESNTPYLGKRWPLLKKPEYPIEFRLRLGQRFDVTGDVKQFVGDLEDYFRHELGQDLKR